MLFGLALHTFRITGRNVQYTLLLALHSEKGKFL